MTVAEKFVEHGIVPDIIPKAPEKELKVAFPSGYKANYGNELTPTNVKDEPNLSWDFKPDSYYTIIHTDPDAPSRKSPTLGEVEHWLVANVKGGDVSTGEVFAVYIGSGAPKDTGLHRYIFLVYEQPNKQKISYDHPYIDYKKTEERLNFKVQKFVEKYGLGTPIAGNFYQAQYDDYVPIVQKE